VDDFELVREHTVFDDAAEEYLTFAAASRSGHADGAEPVEDEPCIGILGNSLNTYIRSLVALASSISMVA
jgi:hypothetical protein